jgi:hypothetical protein
MNKFLTYIADKLFAKAWNDCFESYKYAAKTFGVKYE